MRENTDIFLKLFSLLLTLNGYYYRHYCWSVEHQCLVGEL